MPVTVIGMGGRAFITVTETLSRGGAALACWDGDRELCYTLGGLGFSGIGWGFDQSPLGVWARHLESDTISCPVLVYVYTSSDTPPAAKPHNLFSFPHFPVLF